MRCHDLPIRLSLHPPRELLCCPHVLTNSTRQPIRAKRTHHHPQLQRPEPPPQLHPIVHGAGPGLAERVTGIGGRETAQVVVCAIMSRYPVVTPICAREKSLNDADVAQTNPRLARSRNCQHVPAVGCRRFHSTRACPTLRCTPVMPGPHAIRSEDARGLGDPHARGISPSGIWYHASTRCRAAIPASVRVTGDRAGWRMADGANLNRPRLSVRMLIPRPVHRPPLSGAASSR